MFHTFPGRLPLPSPHMSGNGPRTQLIIPRPLSLDRCPGLQEIGVRAALGPLPTNPGNPRGFPWISGCDPWRGPPLGSRACGVCGALAATGDFKGGQRSKHFRGTCSGGRCPRPAAGTRPCLGARLPRAGPEEAGGGRRGRGGDLGPGCSAGGREGAYYRSAPPGFQKFLLVLWKFRRRSPEGGQNSHLGEKAWDRGFQRNRAHGVLSTPHPLKGRGLQKGQRSPFPRRQRPSAFRFRDQLSVGEIWNLADLDSVSGFAHLFIYATNECLLSSSKQSNLKPFHIVLIKKKKKVSLGQE